MTRLKLVAELLSEGYLMKKNCKTVRIQDFLADRELEVRGNFT